MSNIKYFFCLKLLLSDRFFLSFPHCVVLRFGLNINIKTIKYNRNEFWDNKWCSSAWFALDSGSKNNLKWLEHRNFVLSNTSKECSNFCATWFIADNVSRE